MRWLVAFQQQYDSLGYGTTERQQNLDAFIQKCATIPSCSAISAPSLELVCSLTDPSKAEFGGTKFHNFLMWVIIVLSVRVVLDVSKLLLICVCIFQKRVVGSGWAEDFLAASPFQSLLWIPLRDQYFAKVARYQPTHRDLLRRLLHQFLLMSAPLLLINLLYFNSIAQTGLTVLNILSMLNGIVTVPLLLGLALKSWCELRRARKNQKNDQQQQQQRVGEASVNTTTPPVIADSAINSETTKPTAPSESQVPDSSTETQSKEFNVADLILTGLGTVQEDMDHDDGDDDGDNDDDGNHADTASQDPNSYSGAIEMVTVSAQTTGSLNSIHRNRDVSSDQPPHSVSSTAQIADDSDALASASVGVSAALSLF
jgi:hypothetical protein